MRFCTVLRPLVPDIHQFAGGLIEPERVRPIDLSGLNRFVQLNLKAAVAGNQRFIRVQAGNNRASAIRKVEATIIDLQRHSITGRRERRIDVHRLGSLRRSNVHGKHQILAVADCIAKGHRQTAALHTLFHRHDGFFKSRTGISVGDIIADAVEIHNGKSRNTRKNQNCDQRNTEGHLSFHFRTSDNLVDHVNLLLPGNMQTGEILIEAFSDEFIMLHRGHSLPVGFAAAHTLSSDASARLRG